MWGPVWEKTKVEFWRYRPKETVCFVTQREKPVVSWELVTVLVEVNTYHLLIASVFACLLFVGKLQWLKRP